MKIYHDFHTVTAADLVRSFAACRDRATLSPLFISNHGRNTHVLIGIDQFNEFIELRHNTAGEPVGPGVLELADWMDDAVIITDATLRIAFANRVAHAICRKRPGSLNGTSLSAELPQFSGSLLEVHARRTLVSNEPSAADLPSPFADNAWLRFQTFPIGDQLVMIFRDISDEVQQHRVADVKKSLLQALDAHGEIGYVRVSPRATIERVDQPLCDLIGLPQQRLINLPLIDLVAKADRPHFRAELDAVIRGAAARKTEIALVGNDGNAKPVIAALATLQGAYGAEGAVILTTPCPAK
ncbi:MAG: PAS domain-containing protein [Novosphingobium sp.]